MIRWLRELQHRVRCEADEIIEAHGHDAWRIVRDRRMAATSFRERFFLARVESYIDKFYETKQGPPADWDAGAERKFSEALDKGIASILKEQNRLH